MNEGFCSKRWAASLLASSDSAAYADDRGIIAVDQFYWRMWKVVVSRSQHFACTHWDIHDRTNRDSDNYGFRDSNHHGLTDPGTEL
jgi:hypothetical protein